MLKRLLPFLPLVLLVACTPAEEISPHVFGAVVQTQTALMWTPAPVTPSPTSEPNTGRIVNTLNGAMLGADPLSETIEARFSVVEAQVLKEAPGNLDGVLRIYVECEWVYSDGCTVEKAFVSLMKAMTRNEKTVKVISNNIPATVRSLQMVALKRMSPQGMIQVSWQDVLDYAQGKISGSQLGVRIMRVAAP